MKRTIKYHLNTHKAVKKYMGYIIVSVLFAMILFGCLSMDVYSQSMENAIQADKEQVDLLEKEYIKAMKDTLKGYGCENAGITMKKVYGDEADLYEVEIHHANLQYLDKSSMQQLGAQLQHLVNDFPDTDFSFCFSV